MRHNAKKRSVIIIISIVAVIIVIVAINILPLFLIRKYGGVDIATRKYNMLISGIEKPDAFNELRLAISKYENWNNLFLTNKFKEKFKDYKGVISDIDNYDNIGGGYDYDEFGKKVIFIYAIKKKGFFEKPNSQLEDEMAEFYFEYVVNQDGWLDDVNLLKRIDSDSESVSGKKVYKGFAMGYNDMIDVDVTIDDGKILDVKVTNHNETPGIGGELKDIDGNVVTNGGESPVTLIPRLMVENNSINIDTVTGATVTCYGIEHAVTDAMVKANIRVDAVSSATEKSDYKSNKELNLSDDEKKELQKYLNKVNFDIKHEDMTTDVVVIGGGGAGLTAAISAAKGNANVIVVERNGEVGGNTLVCGAIYNAPDKELQKKLSMNDDEYSIVEKSLTDKAVNDEHKALQDKVRSELDEFKKENPDGKSRVFDSESWFALQTYEGGDKIGNLKLIETFANNAFKTLKLLEGMGFKIYDNVSQGAGALWERTHTSVMPMGTGIISTLLNEIKKYDNIKILTHVEAKEILRNDKNEVIGLKCIDKNKNEFTISTNKGVIIATGGFSANKDMIAKYNTKWGDLNSATTTNRETSSTGDGIDMGIKVGASTVDMSEIQLLYLGNVKNGKLTRYPKRDVNAVDEIIFIDKKGNRFVNEGDRRDVISKSILNLDENFFYILESGDGDDYVNIYGPDFESADGFNLKYLVDNEYIYVGDTLEELCEKINVPVENLKKTIEDFNSCVDGSKKDDFGRTLYSTKLTKGPYVATPRKVSVHHTMGGLKINEKAQVLDANNNVIKGLYAAGEVTGGIHGANRLGGNAVADITIFGTIAGENIIKREPLKSEH